MTLSADDRPGERAGRHRGRSGPAAARRRPGGPRRAAGAVDTAAHRRVGRRRAARRPGVGDDRPGPRRDGQRDLVRLRRRLHLLHRLPLLLDLHREAHHAAGRPARDACRVQRERPGLHADGPACALRPPLRGDRRRRPAGRAGTRGAVGLPARHAVDHRGRHPGRGRAGLPRAVLLDAPRRALAGADGPRGTGSRRRVRRPARHAGDHDHHRGDPRPGGGERARRESVGRLLGRDDHPDRPVHGRLPAVLAARAKSPRSRSSASSC